MSRLALGSFILSTVGCLLVALSFAQISRASAEIRKLEAGARPADGKEPNSGGAGSAETAAEIARLKAEVARLREAVAKVPVGGSSGASLGDVEKAVNQVMADRASVQRRKDAERSGEMMKRAEEKFVALLTSRLGLALDQQATVKDLLAAETRECVEAWSADLTHENRQQKLMEIHGGAMQAIEGLLKEEQKVEWGAINKQWFGDLPATTGGSLNSGTGGR